MGQIKLVRTLLVLFWNTYYKWGHTENCVKCSDVPSTSAQSQEVYISETNDINATKETNQDLRCLRIKNLKKLIIEQLNINSLRTKLDLLIKLRILQIFWWLRKQN